MNDGGDVTLGLPVPVLQGRVEGACKIEKNIVIKSLAFNGMKSLKF